MKRLRTAWRLALIAAPVLSACVPGTGVLGGSSPTLADDGGVDGGAPGEDAGPHPEFGLSARPANPTCIAPERPVPTAAVRVVPAFDKLRFAGPVAMLQAPGDATKWYVVQKGGVVRTFANDDATATASDFIDISARVNSGPQEAGLLGMAFHPQYATNQRFFLSYTAPSGSSPANLRSTVARFTSANGTGDPNSFQPVLPPNDDGTAQQQNVLDQPYENHNGGNIAFGPDGFLYLGLGDGGNGGDPENRAQNLNVMFGKMLRIDVDNVPAGKRYGIPADNPFAGGGGLPELYAWGLRNPWRWSFDRETGQLWCGDVGQDNYEEVDVIQRGGNYGWRLREAGHCYNPGTNCPTAGLIDPIVEYGHNGGSRSITGGYVYHGTAIPGLVGRYVYADEVNGDLYAVSYDAMGKASHTLLLNMPGSNISSFAQDADGELYLVDFSGSRIWKIVPAGPPKPDTFPTLLSKTGCFDPQDATKPAGGLIPYAINSPLWSDGAGKGRWMALPDGAQIHVNADGDWDLPNGSVLIKEFAIGTKRVETRLLMRHPDGIWAGYSYEWNDAGTDATLLPAGKTKDVGGQSWTYPARSDCLVCHTAAAGRSLGLETAQLDRLQDYPGTGLSAQLATLDHIGLFDAPLAMAYPLPNPSDTTETLEHRARAYLHANCSFCHRPNSTGQGPADYRFGTPFAMVKACNADPQEGDLGIMGAKLIFPGQSAKSLMSRRMHSLDTNRMPPLATARVDMDGTQVIDAWIDSLTGCP